MDFLNQLKSLVQLPGTLYRSKQAKSQANKVQSQLQSLPQTGVSAPAATIGGTTAPNPTPASIQPPPNIDPTTGFNYGGPVANSAATNSFGQPSAPPVVGPTQPDVSSQLTSITSGLQGIQSGLQAQPAQEEIARRRAEDELLRGLQISPEEEQTQKQLNALITSRELGLRGVEEKPIAMEFITGQKAALERRAATQSLPLTQNLALLQAKRQAATDIAKTKLDIEEKRTERAKPDEEKVGEYTDKNGSTVVVYKNKKTRQTRNVTLSGLGKEKSATEKQTQAKTQAFAVARPILSAAKKGGFVDRDTYMKTRQDYAEAIGDVKEFDDVFSPMLSPDDRKQLFKSPSFTTDALASLFGSL